MCVHRTCHTACVQCVELCLLNVPLRVCVRHACVCHLVRYFVCTSLWHCLHATNLYKSCYEFLQNSDIQETEMVLFQVKYWHSLLVVTSTILIMNIQVQGLYLIKKVGVLVDFLIINHILYPARFSQLAIFDDLCIQGEVLFSKLFSPPIYTMNILSDMFVISLRKQIYWYQMNTIK